MISHSHKFIFIHIPKCAGTAIESALYPYAAESTGTNFARKKRAWRNRELFRILKEHPDYFVFTFVRNPFSLLVSAWNYFEVESSENVNFEGFIELVCDFLAQDPEPRYREVPFNHTSIRFGRTKESGFDYDFSGHLNYLFASPGLGYHILPQTYFIADQTDFIGRLENIKNDWEHVRRHIGVEVEIKKENTSKSANYRDYYNDHTRSLVETAYSNDLDFLGYQF